MNLNLTLILTLTLTMIVTAGSLNILAQTRNVTLAVVDSIKERCLQWIGRDCWENPQELGLGLGLGLGFSVILSMFP